MTRAVCPGSFDPVTYGHLDVIGRVAAVVDEVVVAVGGNVSKRGLFSPAERVEMLQQACAGWPNVTVTRLGGLLVDFCREHQISVIAKGLRAGDLAYEVQMAQMNRHLTGVDTLFLATAPEWAFVSSSLVREVATLGGDIAGLVPPAVAERVRARVSAPTGSGSPD